MHTTVLEWIVLNIDETDVRGKSVLEVGSRNINGTARKIIERMKPKSYLGFDYMPGEGVDEVWDARYLSEKFGENSFDVVLSTEMLEYVDDWRKVITEMKRVLRPDGILIITTRSPGFPYHGFPYDFWRYTLEDFKIIFSDFIILVLSQDDPQSPGVMMKAKNRSISRCAI